MVIPVRVGKPEGESELFCLPSESRVNLLETSPPVVIALFISGKDIGTPLRAPECEQQLADGDYV